MSKNPLKIKIVTDYIQTHDNQYLCVDRIGTGKRIAILLHGIGGSSHLWVPFALQHRGDYTFIIPNLRGFGKSKHVKFDKKDDVILDYARDIHTLVNHYRGQGKVTIAALSMGAYSAMKYFEIYGDTFVEKYLNIDQSPKAINGSDWNHGLCGVNQEGMFALFNKSRQDFSTSIGIPFAGIQKEVKNDYILAVGKFIEAALHRPIEKKALTKVRQLPVLSRLMTRALSADIWESYYHCLQSYQGQNYDFRGTMCGLDIPITLFVGKHSEMYPSEGQLYIQKHGHNVTAHQFEESHALMYTAPLQFTRQFNKFLRGH